MLLLYSQLCEALAESLANKFSSKHSLLNSLFLKMDPTASVLQASAPEVHYLCGGES